MKSFLFGLLVIAPLALSVPLPQTATEPTVDIEVPASVAILDADNLEFLSNIMVRKRAPEDEEPTVDIEVPASVAQLDAANLQLASGSGVPDYPVAAPVQDSAEDSYEDEDNYDDEDSQEPSVLIEVPASLARLDAKNLAFANSGVSTTTAADSAMVLSAPIRETLTDSIQSSLARSAAGFRGFQNAL